MTTEYFDIQNLNTYLSSVMGIIGALIGGWMTGRYSLKAIKKSHANELKRIKFQESTRVKSFLQALQTEIESLWAMYIKSMGGDKSVESLPSGEPIFMTIPLNQSYFNIYEGNTSVIGQIEDKNLRDAIVRCYVQAKGLVDTLKMNNSLIQKYETRCLLCGQFNNEYNQQLVANSLKELKNYSEMVIKYHYDTKKEVEILMSLLSKTTAVKVSPPS